jgi:hypothetical protein
MLSIAIATALVVFMIIGFYDEQIPRLEPKEADWFKKRALIKTILGTIGVVEFVFLMHYLSR